ncbi:MAG: JAB domain-containing protein [Kiritimatiellales bacterium]
MFIELKTELMAKEEPGGEEIADPEAVEPVVADMRLLAQEAFVVLTLNVKHQLIRRHLVTLGILDKVQIHAREVFRPAILDNAHHIILVHNHPSGDPERHHQQTERPRWN